MRLPLFFTGALLMCTISFGQMKMIIHKSDGKTDSLWLTNIQRIYFQNYGTSHIVNLKFGKDTLLQAKNISIGFKDVLDDSRCPSGVFCKWEGVAKAQFWIKKNDQDTVFINLPIYGYVDRYSQRHITVDTVAVGLSLLQLDPYPKFSNPHPKSEYSSIINVIVQ